MSTNTTITSTDSTSAATSSVVLTTSSSSIETTPTTTTTPTTAATTPTTVAPQATTEQTTSIATTPTTSESASATVITSVVTVTPTDGVSSGQVTTEFITSTQGVTSASSSLTSTSSSSSASGSAGLISSGSKSTSKSGIGSGGTIAIAVVVPIVAVAALIVAGIFFWRKRKQRKDAEEMRRKEVEEYGYNPNNDPTIPAVAGGSDGPFEMREEESGYRGWGTTAVGSSGRKASTTLSGGQSAGGIGMAYSEGTSPTHAVSDTRSDNPLVDHHEDEGMGAMGPASAGNRDINRGPSNASSSYSAANRSDGSGEGPGGYNGGQYYNDQYGGGGNPYTDTPYGSPPNRAEVSGQPVIRDVSARRNTRIENPSHYPGQQSAGISQNF